MLDDHGNPANSEDELYLLCYQAGMAINSVALTDHVLLLRQLCAIRKPGSCIKLEIWWRDRGQQIHWRNGFRLKLNLRVGWENRSPCDTRFEVQQAVVVADG